MFILMSFITFISENNFHMLRPIDLTNFKALRNKPVSDLQYEQCTSQKMQNLDIALILDQ